MVTVMNDISVSRRKFIKILSLPLLLSNLNINWFGNKYGAVPKTNSNKIENLDGDYLVINGWVILKSDIELQNG